MWDCNTCIHQIPVGKNERGQAIYESTCPNILDCHYVQRPKQPKEDKDKMTISVNIPKRGTSLTNGDVVKAMFPKCDIEIDAFKQCVYVFFGGFYNTYPIDWWDDIYKEIKK